MRVFKIPVGDDAIVDMKVKGDDAKELAAAIGCTVIEAHHIAGAPSPRPLLENPMLVVDEEAGFKEVRINKRASYLFGYIWHGQHLRGDALVVWCGSGDFVSIPRTFTVTDLEHMIDIRKDRHGQ